MKLFCGACEPHIDKAADLLRQRESTASDKYKNAKKQNAHAHPQKKDVAQRETTFRTKRKLFREEKLSFKDYYEDILDLFKFVPKDKHVEELEDTDSDESDAETSDDSDNDDTGFGTATSMASDDSALTSITEGVQSLLNSIPLAQPDEVICNFCNNIYKRRGLTRHQLYCKSNPNKSNK